MAATEGQERQEVLRDAERLKFFTDAVVAIAMTLLILPLLESVSDAASEKPTTWQFVHDHRGQLMSFLISFAVIAGFWVTHERLYGFVEHWTGPLMLLNVGWMLSIVFLPVATAMLGAWDFDAVQGILYIGTMLLSSVLMGGMNVLVRRDRRIHGDRRPSLAGITASAAVITLFVVALVVALALPDLNYYAMFALFLVGPLQAVYERVVRRRGVQWD